MIRLEVLPVPILADIPVINVVLMTVRQEHLKTTPVLMLLQPNVVPAATDVKTARPAKLTGTALMSGLPNVVLAIPVPTTVLPVPVAVQAVLPAMTRFMSVRPNAETAVMAVRSIIILIPARADIQRQAAVRMDTQLLPNLVPAEILPELVINVIRRRLMILMTAKPETINQVRFPRQGGVIVKEAVLMMQQSIFGAETNILVQPMEDMRNIFIRIIITLTVRSRVMLQ